MNVHTVLSMLDKCDLYTCQTSLLLGPYLTASMGLWVQYVSTIVPEQEKLALHYFS